MTELDEAWSFKSDFERYERLLAQVKSGRFWTSDKPGRPNKQEFQQQIERRESILAQLREATSPK